MPFLHREVLAWTLIVLSFVPVPPTGRALRDLDLVGSTSCGGDTCCCAAPEATATWSGPRLESGCRCGLPGDDGSPGVAVGVPLDEPRDGPIVILPANAPRPLVEAVGRVPESLNLAPEPPPPRA